MNMLRILEQSWIKQHMLKTIPSRQTKQELALVKVIFYDNVFITQAFKTRGIVKILSHYFSGRVTPWVRIGPIWHHISGLWDLVLVPHSSWTPPSMNHLLERCHFIIRLRGKTSIRLNLCFAIQKSSAILFTLKLTLPYGVDSLPPLRK